MDLLAALIRIWYLLKLTTAIVIVGTLRCRNQKHPSASEKYASLSCAMFVNSDARGLTVLAGWFHKKTPAGRAILPRDDSGNEVQLAHYIPGVGTTESRLLNLSQSLTGAGIIRKMKEAYSFIARNYEAGDEIYLFGFSRGAFTARTLASFICQVGILSRSKLTTLEHVFADFQYLRPRSRYRFNAHTAREPKLPPGTLKCVGVWDTVGALNFKNLVGVSYDDSQPQGHYQLLGFGDTYLSPDVDFALHALAIHENRSQFQPTRWHLTYEEISKKRSQVMKQANLTEFKLLSIERDSLMGLFTPSDPWGESTPTDPRRNVSYPTKLVQRPIPTTWNLATRERVHLSARSTLTPPLEEDDDLLESLLPFEMDIRERWTQMMAKSDESSSRIGGRWRFSTFWQSIFGNLSRNQDGEDLPIEGLEDEELAYALLETPNDHQNNI